MNKNTTAVPKLSIRRLSFKAVCADAKLAFKNIARTLDYIKHGSWDDQSLFDTELLTQTLGKYNFQTALAWTYTYVYAGVWPRDFFLTEGGFDQLEVLIGMCAYEDMAHVKEKVQILPVLLKMAEARARMDAHRIGTSEFMYPGEGEDFTYEHLSALTSLSVGHLRNMVSRKQINLLARRSGREIYFVASDAMRWLEERFEFTATKLVSKAEFDSEVIKLTGGTD